VGNKKLKRRNQTEMRGTLIGVRCRTTITKRDAGFVAAAFTARPNYPESKAIKGQTKEMERTRKARKKNAARQRRGGGQQTKRAAHLPKKKKARRKSGPAARRKNSPTAAGKKCK